MGRRPLKAYEPCSSPKLSPEKLRELAKAFEASPHKDTAKALRLLAVLMEHRTSIAESAEPLGAPEPNGDSSPIPS